MPELTDEQLKTLLDDGSGGVPGFTEDRRTPQNLPGSTLQEARSALRIPMSQEQRRQAFISKNADPNVPLDISSGAPVMQRFKGGPGDQLDSRLKYWSDKYPGLVRPASDGGVIFRLLDEEGKPKDVLVNDYKNMSLGDVAELSGVAAEMVGAILGAVAASLATGGKKVPAGAFARAGRFLGISFGSATGAAAGGLSEDVVTRMQRGLPVDFKSRLTERVTGIPYDMIMDYAVAGGARMLSKGLSPTRGVRDKFVEQGVESADKMGVPISSGERMGSQMVRGFEGILANIQGSEGVFSRFRGAQGEALGSAQARSIGKFNTGSIPNLEQLTAKVNEAVAAANQPAAVAMTKARSQTISNLAKGVNKALDAATTPMSVPYSGHVSKVLRGAAQVKRNSFQTNVKQLYEAAMALPGGRQRILADPELAKTAQQFLTDLPGKEVVEEISSGILDPTGTELMKTVTQRVPDRAFVPGKIRRFLESLASGADESRSLDNLIRMRTQVDNSIAKGAAIKGVQVHDLEQIRDMLTKSIERSTKGLGKGELYQAWKKANDTYASGRKQFDSPSVRLLLKELGDPGYVPDGRLSNRIMSGDDSLKELGDFLGKNSEEFAILKKTIGAEVLSETRNIFDKTIDASALVRNLKNFANKNTEAFDIVFGKYGHAIINDASLLKIADGDKISEVAFSRGLTDPRSTARLSGLIAAERQLDKQAMNQFRKLVGTKSVPGRGFAANTFVDRILDSASPAQVKEFMDLLPQELRQNVRYNTMRKVLSDADRAAKGSDLFESGFNPSRPINVEGLEMVLKGEGRRDVLETVLGKETIDELVDFGRVQRLLNVSSMSSAVAGGLAGGVQRMKILTLKFLKIIPNIFGQALAAEILTNDKVARLLANNAFNPERMGKIYLGIASSTPLLQHMAEAYSIPIAKEFIGHTARAAESLHAIETMEQQFEKNRQLSDEQLMRLLP